MTALAGARRSAGTSRGMSVLIAGRKIASTVPNTTPTRASCQSWTCAPRTSAATIVVSVARMTFEASARSRGGMRSESTPPTSMNSARGMAAAIRIAPSANPDPVMPSTSHDSAMTLNWSPSSDTLSPNHTSRKSRPASGAKSGDRASPGDRAGDDVDGVHSIEMRTPSPLIVDLDDRALDAGRDRLADPVRGRLGDARHLADRGTTERQRDAQVDDGPAGLGHLDAQRAGGCAGRLTGGRRRPSRRPRRRFRRARRGSGRPPRP